MEAIHVASTPSDLYNAVLVDTPLAPYFVNCIGEQDLDEMNIEIIRNTVYKEYLESFYKFCKDLGGTTAEVMCEILGKFFILKESFDSNLFSSQLLRQIVERSSSRLILLEQN